MTIRAELAPHVFAVVAREEVWIIPGGGRLPRLVARREGQGRAVTRCDSNGVHIEASDNPAASQGGSPAQMAVARNTFETDLANQFESLPFAATRLDAAWPVRLTLRGNVSIVAREGIETTRTSLFITASIRERGAAASVVTSPRFMRDDIKLLLAAGAAPSQLGSTRGSTPSSGAAEAVLFCCMRPSVMLRSTLLCRSSGRIGCGSTICLMSTAAFLWAAWTIRARASFRPILRPAADRQRAAGPRSRISPSPV